MSYKELIENLRKPSNIKLINKILTENGIEENQNSSNDQIKLQELFETIKEIDEDMLNHVRNALQIKANVDNPENFVNDEAIVSLFQPGEQSGRADETGLDYKTERLNKDNQQIK